MTPRNNHWNVITVGQLGRIVTGKTPPTSRRDFFGSAYPFVTPTDIHDNHHAVRTARFLSKAWAEKHADSIIPPGGVCVTCIGATIGKICVATKPSFTNQQINSVIVDETSHDSRFVYYLLRHEANRIKSLAGGAATPIVNKTAFSNISVRVPPFRVQRTIGAILSAYDDFIENNTRRIAILEEMARTIYREWFVNFRFPGYERIKLVESEIGAVPSGWEVKSIGEIIETTGGGTPATKNSEFWQDGDIIWFTPSDLTAAGEMFASESAKKITKMGLQNSSARLFPPYSVMMTSRATIGVISINTKDACTNQGFITCIPNDLLSACHIYFWIEDNREMIISIASGATYKEINRTEFRELPIALPDRELETQFAILLDPFTKQIENLLNKNVNLRRTRDLLLPKLISGELDAEKLDIAIPEVTHTGEEVEIASDTP